MGMEMAKAEEQFEIRESTFVIQFAFRPIHDVTNNESRAQQCPS